MNCLHVQKLNVLINVYKPHYHFTASRNKENVNSVLSGREEEISHRFSVEIVYQRAECSKILFFFHGVLVGCYSGFFFRDNFTKMWLL